MKVETLTERENRVLELIMTHYIGSAEPVGSRTLSKAMNNRWSSATIRNIMSDLEEQGFLYKPHVVAGRVPTGKAFRYYVNSLLVTRPPGRRELEMLQAMSNQHFAHVEDIMADTSRLLANLCRYTSIVVEPKINTMTFKEIEFVKMSKSTVLIVFVTSSGMVHTRLVNSGDELDADLLMAMKVYMNERCEGVPFYRLKNQIFEDMRKDRETFNSLLSKVVGVVQDIIEKEDERQVYIDGTSKMIGVPELSDIKRLRELFQAFERKEKLLRLLDKSLEDEGIRIIIGNESDIHEMRDMSIITSTYRIDAETTGILGIIGPIRMNYSRVIPIVNYTARTITSLLNMA
ncbi:MAG TPA: heat-inducible transcription repressor HrcA [Deltaproteobacteria bacterium]|nr:heat-inducible transcription repressor HrcA [Deltaproteobacteria bacterium]